MKKTKMTTEELKENISEIMKREYETSEKLNEEHNFYLRCVFAGVAGYLNKDKTPFKKVYDIIEDIYRKEYLNKLN